ncbi:hypothetical protein ACSDR0_49250 [Streptosporangium sp. G11]|uniref:hypothetical protein n=1 Tax=Streptosporangium sp. G11 TaxID=3436926 RepID=UPI003EBC67E8
MTALAFRRPKACCGRRDKTEKDSTDLGVRPASDFELLEDFGVSKEELELNMEEGVLPADILSVIAERLAFAETSWPGACS